MTVSGDWYWEGATWRRTVESPWSAPSLRPRRGGYRGVLAPALSTSVVFLVGLVAQVLGRALAAAVRIVVGVFAFGAVVALAVFLLSALLRG